MNVITNKKRRNRAIIILAPIVIVIAVLSYYQLFYKSPRVDNSMVKLVTTFTGHTNIINAIKFIPGTDLVASASVDSTVKIWKKETGEVVNTLKHPEGVTHVDISADGKFAATTSYDTKVRLWNLQDGKLLKEFIGHKQTAWHVCFSPDGKKIASSGEGAVAIIWDVETGAMLHTLKGHTRTIWSVKFSPDGNTIATGSYDNTLRFWKAADGTWIKTIDAHDEAIVDIAYSHNGKLLASTSDDKTIKLWNTADHTLLRTMIAEEHIQAIAFSSDDKRIMTGGRDKPMIGEFLQEIFGDSHIGKGVSARLWDVETGKLLQTFTQHANDVNDVAYSNDGKWIATGSADYTACACEVLK